ncbi:ferroxidase fet3 [Coemansia sp. RSA 1200]|nr:ferroxidase fet3 [Coemansia sp. RSA 1200]
MHESGFNTHKLPMNLSKESGVPASNKLIGGRIVPGFFHVIRFRENSGVVVIGSIRHYNTDGYGYTQFMNRWAEIAKWMQQSQSDNSVPFPVRHYIYDRSFHNSYISSETTAIKDMISNPASSGGVLMKWLAWVSPETRGRVMGALSNSTDHTCSFYHISSETMKDLRTRVQAHAPEGIRYSINDILTAYLAIVLGQAKEKAFIEKWKKPARSVVRGLSFKKLGKPKDLVVMIDINSRPRIDLPDAKDYMGNMVSGSSTVFSREQVHQESTDKILSAMALRIHQDVASVDKEFIAQVGHFKNGKPEYYMWPAWFFATRSSKLGISNQFRFEHYGVDFGAGIPTMVRTAPHAFVDNVFVMPANPAIGGYIVELKLEPDVKANLARNEEWMTGAKRVELDWDITYVQANPDGQMERRLIGVNGRWPPPEVHVNLNDTLVINAHNSLDVATSIHAYGLHQNGTNFYDGVPGTTECGIAPNMTYTYVIPVTQIGTFWLQSQYASQFVDGLRTPLISYAPQEHYQYDSDQVLMLEASYHRGAKDIVNQLMSTVKGVREAFIQPYMLINSVGGSDLNRTKISVQSGKTHRLRLINVSAAWMVRFGIEQHTMQIIEIDGIDTEIKEANSVLLSPGQRASVLITAKNTTDHNYIFHADMFIDVGQDGQRTVLPYQGTVEYSPNASLLNYTEAGTSSTVDWEFTQDIDMVPLEKIPTPGVYKWVPLEVSTSTYDDRRMHSAFNNRTYAAPIVPSLLTALTTGYQAYYPDVYGFKPYPVILDPLEDVEVAIFNNDATTHSFHLHGHSFFIIARGTVDKNQKNRIAAGNFPMRRDTIAIPPRAYAIVRFRADNPGAWLFHSQMQFAKEQGLAMTFIEAPYRISANLSNTPADMLESCRTMGIPISGNALGKPGLDLSEDVHGPYPLSGL